jgi:hypothetical protein
MRLHHLLLPCLCLLLACGEKQSSKNEVIQDSSKIITNPNLPPGYNGSPEAKEQAKKRLQLMREKIVEGANFNEMARKYSDDPGSRNNGGCYDSLKVGVFVPEFDAVAFKLKPDEVSEVFETQFGFHIVLCRARHGEEIDICHILIIPK